jgi:hypothetical protein
MSICIHCQGSGLDPEPLNGPSDGGGYYYFNECIHCNGTGKEEPSSKDDDQEE